MENLPPGLLVEHLLRPIWVELGEERSHTVVLPEEKSVHGSEPNLKKWGRHE